jgi:DNA-binding XRE family transcriptional regulator
MDADVAARFQASLRSHRAESGLTLAAMGERVGMKRQSLHRMETEAGYVPLLTTAHLIASFFGNDLTTFVSVEVDTQG